MIITGFKVFIRCLPFCNQNWSFLRYSLPLLTTESTCYELHRPTNNMKRPNIVKVLGPFTFLSVLLTVSNGLCLLAKCS